MLLVAVLFLTGGLGYTLVCRYIGTGVENVGVGERQFGKSCKVLLLCVGTNCHIWINYMAYKY